jgi:VWFA-related protein
MLRRFAAVAVIAVLAGSASFAQQSPPRAGQPAAPPGAPSANEPDPQVPPVTFRVEVNYVEVDAIVTDRNGNVVRDLTRDDFEITEDGKPQKVELFTFVDLPVVRAERPLFSPTPIEPDVRSNAQGVQGRLYVLLLDDLHTAPLRSVLVRQAVTKFINENLGENDYAAVVHLSGRADATQDFTNNKRLLVAAADRFMGRKLRSATLNRQDEYYLTRGIRRENDPIRDPEGFQRAHNARSALESIRNVAQWLDGVRGRRKAIVLFSEGIDYDINDPFTNPDATTIRDSVREAIGTATRANVTLYTVDPRGLTNLGDEMMELGAPPEDPTLGLDSRGLMNELRLAHDSLRVLAEETGGFAVVNQNDFAQAFDRLVRDNSAYYVLGYYPSNDRRDGRFRRIGVRVKRPGLEVRARRGYVAPRGRGPAGLTAGVSAGTSAPLREMLSSPLPESGLPMAVQAAAFKGANQQASVLVTVHVSGRHFKFDEKDGRLLDELEVSMLAVDTAGKVRGGDRSNVELKLSPQSRDAVQSAGMRVVNRLELPPGRYQLRVGARSTNAGTGGTVHYDLEVPDFWKESLALSGVVVTSAGAARTPTARHDETLKELLPGPPTVTRDFTADDTLVVLAEVYDNERRPHRVDISTTLRADDGRVLSKTEEERSVEELAGGRGGYVYRSEVPLRDLPPGLYVLRVEARSRLRSDQPVARDIQVRVHPAPELPRSRRGAEAAPAQPRSVVAVTRGLHSAVDEYREVVARNEAEWQALWKSLPVGEQASPRVTFENTMVVAVFLGSRPTSGYSVEFTGVALDGDTLVVEYAEREPAPGTMTAQVMTSPFAVAGVPRHEGPVRFARAERGR